ncbi:hypothetical protein KKG29_01645 [Patescibacteria group bacterium]|nr:hypothetical protein [Patescibacteria group bacterium]MBU4057123.1 hypothetical protein [Patescibacteria group bacterium]MBU4368163.1 hypothetical protein [Patescibacteria group bacterium]
MWFDKFWDPLKHRLLVKYTWSEDISSKKGCDFDFNVVIAVISMNVETQEIEAIYMDKTKSSMSCPIY